MNCKDCPFYTLETVPVLDDDLQPVSGQFTKARMCTAGDNDTCPVEVSYERDCREYEGDNQRFEAFEALIG